MLNVYPVSQEIVRAVIPLARKIAAQNKNLADQLERAVISVPLNLAEGAGTVGGHRRQRYLTALGSAREVRAALETSVSAMYVDAIDAALLDRIDRVIGTLVRVLRVDRVR